VVAASPPDTGSLCAPRRQVDGGSAKPAGACEKPAGDPLESASATLWEGSKNYLAPGAERALSAF
jgi:hypothetical protein